MIYIVQGEVTRRVKIGYTSATSSKKRITQLQTGSSERLLLLGTMEGGVALEKTIHEHLHRSHVHGEWFECSEEVQRFLAGLSDQEVKSTPHFLGAVTCDYAGLSQLLFEHWEELPMQSIRWLRSRFRTKVVNTPFVVMGLGVSTGHVHRLVRTYKMPLHWKDEHKVIWWEAASIRAWCLRQFTPEMPDIVSWREHVRLRGWMSQPPVEPYNDERIYENE